MTSGSFGTPSPRDWDLYTLSPSRWPKLHEICPGWGRLSLERCSVPASECWAGMASRAGRGQPVWGCTAYCWWSCGHSRISLSFGFFFQAWILYFKGLLSGKPSKEKSSSPIAGMWKFAGGAGGGMRVRGSLVEP